MLLSLSAVTGCWTSGPARVRPPQRVSAARELAPAPAAGPLMARREDQRKPLPEALLPEALHARAEERAWKYIVLHHSATGRGDVAAIDAAHRQRRDGAGRPWLGIGYHFVIGNGQGMADGLIEPTFRWDEQIHGAHAGVREYNESSIGICLIGDFEKQPPTPRQVEAARQLVTQLARRYGIPPGDILTHGDLAATLCPGRHFPLAQIVGDKETTE